MNFNEIPVIFNRALSLTFSLKKILLVFIVLALCGIMVVFFRGLSVEASSWMFTSLTFLPFFLCTGVLLSTGVFLTRVYHDEVKNKSKKYRDILNQSWEVIIGASYFSIPIILSYLLLWLMLGVFILLRQIPGIGEVIVILLAFAPFLLNLSILILCVLNLGMLFFLTPIIALKGVNNMRVTDVLVKRFKGDFFVNVLMSGLALLPLIVIGGFLTLAAVMTDHMCEGCKTPLAQALEAFFLMIPFAALIAPAVVFFFNFAVESHVLSQKAKS